MASPLHKLAEILASMSGKEEAVNENNRKLEQGANHFVFIDRDLLAAPAGVDGDCYLLPAAGALTGAWAGANNGDIAYFINTAWVFLTPFAGMRGYVEDEDVEILFDGTSWSIVGGAPKYSMTIALSDLTSDLTVGTSKAYWEAPFPITITGVTATVIEAPTGADIEVDINEAGVSILSTVISVDAGQVRSLDSTPQPVVSDALIAGRLTFDIDQVGSTNAGKGLQVTIEYTET